MISPIRSSATFAVVLATLLATTVTIEVVRDRLTPAHQITARYLYVRSDTALRRLAVAYQALLADVYWIRTIQHYGGDRLSIDDRNRYELLYPLLDITTTLDPRFTLAYRFGAIFLAEPFPGGPGRPDQAVALLRKGVQASPSKWEYVHDIAFVYYWQLRDAATAARWFQRASEIPGAPEWLQPLAATMLIQGGDRTSSRFLWRQLHASAEQDWLRSIAERRLVQLDALDQIDQLEAAVRRFERQVGPERLTWPRLVREGVVPGVPVDPTGTPYELDPIRGTVTVSPRSELFPMPIEPPRAGPPTS